MRLLQDGHFKGVADVRLRINFHQEITRQQTAHLKEVAQEGVAGVIETIASQVNALIEGWIRARPEQWLWLHRRWPE